MCGFVAEYRGKLRGAQGSCAKPDGLRQVSISKESKDILDVVVPVAAFGCGFKEE